MPARCVPAISCLPRSGATRSTRAAMWWMSACADCDARWRRNSSRRFAMWATASARADRLLFLGWAAFAAVNVVLMFAMPGKETVPFHFVWISLSLVYGLQPWSLTRTYAVLAAVGTVTGWALVHHVQNGVIGWEETTEVPL